MTENGSAVHPRERKRKRNRQRNFKANTSYHVFSRRPGKLKLFRDREDYLVFGDLIRRLLADEPTVDKWGNVIEPLGVEIKVLAYCLMPTHFHLVVHQGADKTAVSELMRRLKRSLTHHHRRRYGHRGPLFEGPYGHVEINNPNQLTSEIAYVHANPIERALDHEWSSHGLYVGTRADRWTHWCDAQSGLDAFHSRAHYLERLYGAIEEKRRQRIKSDP